MQLKVSLHIHTNEDKKDGHMIDYNIYQLIDESKKKGFDVLGFTPHQKFVFKEEFAKYAKTKGILLIPGIERSLGRVFNNHVIILNCDKTIEKVRNFKQLIKYKKDHPKIFVLAPDPTFSRLVSIGRRNLKKYIDIFDAVEYSWLYSKSINANNKAGVIASQHKKPMISTADVHVLKKLDMDYAIIDADFLNIDSVLNSIKQGRFVNITEPKKLLHIISHVSAVVAKYIARYVEVNILGLKIKKLEVVKELAASTEQILR
jgi:predicted metal-dependent phosphoesterase TrpH